MTLLITIIAAAVTTAVWYFCDKRKDYKLGALALIYWGASLMWFMDFVFEYAELKADYFQQGLSDIMNDSLLGVTVVAIGLVAWLIILFAKDPKGVIKKSANK
ncbi:MAG: hypothetical protein E7514_07905 [Ruminococcaceae bacterium]|nr:hypothetical protein [Oscillospiraceae bacterium]